MEMLCRDAAALYRAGPLAGLSRNFMRTEGEGREVDVDHAWSTLMAAAQAGDRIAYERLLRDCVPHVKRIVRRSGVRQDLVDDVVQEVLLTIHRARQTYDPSRSFKAWLSAIAQRRAIDMLRQRGRQDRREVFDETEYDNHPDLTATPEQAWEDEARRLALRDAVASLPAGQREAMESLAMRQLSLEEAAKATGKTKGALKVNLHRALKALRLRSGQGD